MESSCCYLALQASSRKSLAGALFAVAPQTVQCKVVPRLKVLWSTSWFLQVRALALEPKFVLLDEPFAGVDPLAVSDIQAVITGLKRRNIGVLITDHNVRETLGIVDRAYIMNNGELLVSGTPDEIVNNERARKFYLGEEFKM